MIKVWVNARLLSIFADLLFEPGALPSPFTRFFLRKHTFMARPQETFNKKELEKKRAQKKKDKEQRKQDRKANAKSGQSLDDMMAYVDENGNLSATPPDPLKKRSVNVNEIVTGSRNEGGATVTVKKGKVSFFDTAKGFGFIIDSESGERIFVHINSLKVAIKENDMVTFETERGPKGLQARDVKVIK